MRVPLRNRRKLLLQVETLESMVLMSGVSTAISLPPVPVTTLTTPLPIIVALKGITHGNYISEQKTPDVGRTFTVFTSGMFEHYGPAVVFGSFHSLGNVASGMATGTLHVVVAGGTLTLSLTGPTQKGPADLPKEFSFVITKGTGKFHNAAGDPTGKGTVDVTLKPDPSSSAKYGHGEIILTFHPGTVAVA
jgi:hypothetical protein